MAAQLRFFVRNGSFALLHFVNSLSIKRFGLWPIRFILICEIVTKLFGFFMTILGAFGGGLLVILGPL